VQHDTQSKHNIDDRILDHLTVTPISRCMHIITFQSVIHHTK